MDREPPSDRRRRLRDRDSAELVMRLKTATWGAGAGAIMGMMVGALLVFEHGWPFLTILGAMIAGAGLVYGAARLVTLSAGRAAGVLHAPSGHSTPYRTEFSLAEAFEARGDYRTAATVYREAIAEQPQDPEPRQRLARLLRDRLGKPEEAERQWREARKLVPPGSHLDLRITRELVELALDYLQDPPHAAPELARLIDRFPNSPEATWAREELADIKRHLQAQ